MNASTAYAGAQARFFNAGDNSYIVGLILIAISVYLLWPPRK